MYCIYSVSQTEALVFVYGQWAYIDCCLGHYTQQLLKAPKVTTQIFNYVTLQCVFTTFLYSGSTMAMSPLPMYDAAGSPSSGSRSAASPAPPELPPRQYRKPDIIAGEDQVPAREGTELFSSNDSDVDSTLKRDTYAQQLRQEARRLSHSHSSSHALRRQPTLQSSNWKASSVSDNFSPQWDGQGEGEIGMAPLSERPAHYYSASSHMPLDGRIGENCDNEQTIEYAGAEPTSWLAESEYYY